MSNFKGGGGGGILVREGESQVSPSVGMCVCVCVCVLWLATLCSIVAEWSRPLVLDHRVMSSKLSETYQFNQL